MQRVFRAIADLDVYYSPTNYVQEILQATCKHLGYNCGAVFKIKDDGNPELFAAYNLPDDYPAKIDCYHERAVWECPLGEAISAKSIRVYPDALSEPSVGPWMDSILDATKFRTVVWVPLINNGDVYGVYVLYSASVVEVTDEELKGLEQLGVIVSLAVSSNQYLDQLNHKTKQLEKEISERKKIEEDLRASENRFRTIFESAAMGVSRVTLSGRFLESNLAFQEMLGYSPEELNQMTFFEITYARDLALNRSLFDDLLKGKRPRDCYQMEKRYYRKDGNLIWVQLTVSLVRDSRGEPEFCIGMMEDITERKQMEETLRQSERRIRLMFEFTPVGIVRSDLDGKWVEINIAMQNMLGYSAEELQGKSFLEFIHPDDIDIQALAYQELVQGKRNLVQAEKRYICKDASIVWCGLTTTLVRDGQGEPLFTISMIENVTDRKHMEEEILKARMLESIGILAGGIAHDFNNILTVILGNASLLKIRTSPKRKKTMERLNEIEIASKQARDLTRQLLTFAKGGAPIVKPASITELIHESVSFALRGSNARCKLTIAEDLFPVEVDSGQISQVLNNIMINAYQAMPDGGTILLGVRNVTLDEGHSLPLNNGNYIRLSIAEQGVGISKENLGKIFDPYFTTKAEGSGLGLATSYSIIKKHQGHISVESELGRGTTFHVYLPAANCQLPNAEPESLPVRGKGKILIMDDEKNVREVVCNMLAYYGYRSESARDGSEVIAKYRHARDIGDPFDIVIMDLTIPGGVGGKEALERLRRIDPNVKGIVSSGYSNDPIMANYHEYGFQGVIAKPYRAGDLSKVLAKVLEPCREIVNQSDYLP